MLRRISKTNIKRMLCAALALIMLYNLPAIQLRADEDEENLGIVDGHVTLYDYRKMTGLSDIAEKKDKGWFPFIMVYDASKNDVKTRRILSGEDSMFYNYEDNDYTEIKGNIVNDQNLGNLDEARYITDKMATKMWIKVVGTNNGNNAGMPMCEISLGDEPGKKYLVAHDADDGFRTSQSGGTIFTIKTNGNGADNFIICEDIRNAVDKSWQKSGNDGEGIWLEDRTIKCSESKYKKFSIYIGEAVEYDAITRDHTILEGETARVNENVILKQGVKINVRQGGIFIVEGLMFNNGEINNNGTVIVSNGAKIQPYLSSGGSISCDGGDMIIENGGRVICEKSVTLNNGASVVNKGLFIVGQNIDIRKSLIDNRADGKIYEGYHVNKNIRSFSYTYSDEELESRLYGVRGKVTNVVDSSKLINKGTIYRYNTLEVGSGCVSENRDNGKVR